MIADLTPAALPAAIWGNKAARLSEVSSLGYAVPAGLCVTYATAQQAPNSIAEALATWLGLYQPDLVAIRMSSIHEDQLAASHAGQTTSVLGCRPDVATLMTVLEDQILPYAAPWASRTGGLSFIFQCQIAAQLGGVAFLTDGRLTAEAKLASTDGITAGQAPDVTLDLSGTSLTATGAVSAVPVATLAQTLKIACGGLRRHFKFDIDLEWAWRQGVLYTLQARPVTTSL